MQGDKQVIAHLNAQLKNELTAINQYFLHARMLDHWGLKRLGKVEYRESVGEMKHADRLIGRILMLDGLPNMQDPGKLNVGENVPDMLNGDLALERSAQQTLKEAIAHCENVRDFASRELLDDILDDTEGHIDWLETQLALIERSGCRTTCSRRWSRRRAEWAGAMPRIVLRMDTVRLRPSTAAASAGASGARFGESVVPVCRGGAAGQRGATLKWRAGQRR